MKFKLDINVSIEAVYDTETEKFEIIFCKPTITKKETINLNQSMHHKMTKTQINFGILTLGARSIVGTQLPLGQSITVKLIDGNNTLDERKIITHKTVRGRIDGLTSLYANHKDIKVDTELDIRYINDTKILEIRKA